MTLSRAVPVVRLAARQLQIPSRYDSRIFGSRVHRIPLRLSKPQATVTKSTTHYTTPPYYAGVTATCHHVSSTVFTTPRDREHIPYFPSQMNNNHADRSLHNLLISRSYSDKVHDHFRKPRNVGSFDKNETGVVTALVGKAACGDVIKLQVKVDNGRIVDAKFKTFGCGSAIASSSFATELIIGKTFNEALSLRNTDIADHLSLPPVKLHCSMLAEDAIKLAIKDYQAKYPNIKEGSVE